MTVWDVKCTAEAPTAGRLLSMQKNKYNLAQEPAA